MNTVTLHDGRPLDLEHFHFHDTEYRRVTLADKLAMKMAWEVCEGTPRYSVVIAMRSGILAGAFGCADGLEACRQAANQMEDLYRTKGFRLPTVSISAALNFIPVSNEMGPLKVAGVDGLFLAKGLVDAQWPGSFLQNWIGPYLDFDGKKYMRRGVWVEPVWSRMDKIHRKLQE